MGPYYKSGINFDLFIVALYLYMYHLLLDIGSTICTGWIITGLSTVFLQSHIL